MARRSFGRFVGIFSLHGNGELRGQNCSVVDFKLSMAKLDICVKQVGNDSRSILSLPGLLQSVMLEKAK